MRDIIIIGGGLLGAATAYQLSKLQPELRITLFERGDTASGASARAACLLTKLRTKADVAAMVEETYHSIKEIEGLLEESLNLQQCGSITIGWSEPIIEYINSLAKIAEATKIEHRFMTKEEVKEALPWIDTTLVGKALLTTQDAFIDSAVWCNAMIRAAQKQGVEVRSNTKVEEILMEGTKAIGVKLQSQEIIKGQAVVNAAGAWGNLLIEDLPYRLAHTPVRSHFWITEVDQKRFPANAPFTVLSDATSFTRADSGAMIVGIREPECIAYDPKTLPLDLEYLEIDQNDSWKTLSESAEKLKPYFPDLLNTGIAHYVAGPSCYVPDANFLIGKLPETEGLYAIGGCCGGGVAAGAGMGRLMAEIILGKQPFVDPTPFRLDRFGKVDPFSKEFQLECAYARSNKKGG